MEKQQGRIQASDRIKINECYQSLPKFYDSEVEWLVLLAVEKNSG